MAAGRKTQFGTWCILFFFCMHKHVDGILETHDDEKTFKQATASLSFLLRLYFFSPRKCRGGFCSVLLLNIGFMLLQILKLIVTTILMFQFGQERNDFTGVVHKGHTTLRHLLLKEWDATWESPPYPPSRGDFAVYKVKDLEDNMNYAVNQFYHFQDDAIGHYTVTDKKMQLHIDYFVFSDENRTESGGFAVKTLSFAVTPPINNATESYTILDDFERNNLTDAIKGMLNVELHFELLSLRVQRDNVHARCLHIAGKVLFEDRENNGQVNMDLDTLTTRIDCAALHLGVPNAELENTALTPATVSLVLLLLSVTQTVGTVGMAVALIRKTKLFMKKYFKRYFHPTDGEECDLPPTEYYRIVKRCLWDVAAFISDILVLSSVFMIIRANDVPWTLEVLDSLSVRLSIGNIIAWMALLKYFRFHQKLDLLFLTLYGAFWDVLAFLLCIIVIFMAFWMCGYVALGPYHVKFSTPSFAMETLFGISTGDEIFATLAMLEADRAGGDSVLIFSRVYIIAYVSLFTIVAINLLIALFNSAYESIKKRDEEKSEEEEEGPLQVALRKFLREGSNQHLRSSLYDMLRETPNASERERVVRKELSKLVRQSRIGNDVEEVVHRPRKLRTLMLDNTEEPDPCFCFLSCSCCRT